MYGASVWSDTWEEGLRGKAAWTPLSKEQVQDGKETGASREGPSEPRLEVGSGAAWFGV